MTGWSNRTTSYLYYANSSSDTITYINGTTTEYACDPAAHLTQIWHKSGTQTIAQHTYTPDAVGNWTQEDEVLGQVGTSTTRPVTTSYDYDRLARLKSVTVGSTITSYEYDPVGNRLRKTASASSPVNYTYDRADRITSAGGVSYTPDANGNVVGRGNDIFRYDAANRLISASVGLQTQTAELQALTNHTTNSSYSYDGDGQRASKTASGATTQYTWDNVGTPTLLEDGSRTYVWGPGHSYSESSDGALEVLHQDRWRSVRAVSNVSGKLRFTGTH